MIKSAASKVMWVGRATVFVVGLAVILALVVGVASAAFGANGGNFILGQLNRATATTQLNGNVSGKPALHVANPNTANGSRALQLNVAQGKPAVVVNASAGKAPNLNADELDGLDSARLAGTGDSRYRGSDSICNPGGADFTATLPVSVRKESLLFATARAGIQANGKANASTLMSVELLDGANTRLASTGIPSQAFSAEGIDVRDLVSEGVLKSGVLSPSEAPFVLRPGEEYVLRMTVSPNGNYCNEPQPHPIIWSSSLSYILLGTP